MADREAREDKDGEVVDTSGASGTKGGGGERAGDGEWVPDLVPVKDVAVLGEPWLDPWAAYNKCIVKVAVVTEGVGTALGEKVVEV